MLHTLRASLTLFIIVLNTLILIWPLLLFTLFKLVFPVGFIRRPVNRVLVAIAELWISINNTSIRLISGVTLHVSGTEGLSYDDWYLVTANHQSWADILIMQMVLNRRIPSLKFFLKQELIKVPLLGVAWWALDFPFMKRYTKEEIAKNPSLKGKDLETTRKACEKFQDMPTSVMNFFEGTRFTQEKHDKQQSPYRNLLKPKSGGTAFALAAMQGKLHRFLDITLIYPPNSPTHIIDFLGGRIPQITVIINQRTVPEWASQGDYQEDPEFRQRFQQWITSLWQEKDQLIDKHRQ